MRTVRSRGNASTELKLINFFRRHGLTGWRRNYPLLGKPDFVFSEFRLTVFVDGCFWHGHNCRNLRPEQNKNYWKVKIDRNKKRDRLVTKELKDRGWHVLRIWECQLSKKSERRLLGRIIKYVRF